MPRRIGTVGTGDVVYLQETRQPVHRVLLYDGVIDSISAIVTNTAKQTPLDITDEVENLTVTENLGAAGQCQFTFIHGDDTRLNPRHFMGRKYIQVLYSDRRLIENFGADFFEIFTGVIAGQPGFTDSRNKQEKKMTVQAYDRQWSWNRRGKKINSPEFLQGVDFGDVAVELATDKSWGMGLDKREVAFGLQGQAILHERIQLRDDPAIKLLNDLLFMTNKIAQFDGSGSLVSRDFDFNKAPIRVYDKFDGVIKDYSWSQELIDTNNVVRILGLDSVISEVVHQTQVVADLNGTVGYFQKEFSEVYFYTDDHRGRVRGIFISKKDINGFLPNLGSSVTVTARDDFSFTLVFDTPYNAWLFITFFAIYILLITIASLPLVSIWSSIFHVAAALWLTAGLLIMQQIGTFQVEVSGKFFEQVYQQLSSEARWSHTSLEEVRRKEIRNDLIGTQTIADAIAQRELIKEAVKGAPRNFEILEDTALEVADIIETRDGSRFFIKTIQRRLERTKSDPIMNVTAWKIRDGNEFNNVAGIGPFP